MKHSRATIAALAALLVAACAQAGMQVRGTAGPGEGPARVAVGQGGELPRGTTVWLGLDERISVERNRVGDRFRARLSQDVVSTRGELLLPRGTPVTGRIIELRPAAGDEPAAVGLALDSIEVAGAREPLRATIVDTERPGVRRRVTVKGKHVLGGAAAGAILGGLLGGRGGLLVGGVLGAGAGTLVSLGLSRERAELPAGTQLAVRIDRPVRTLASLRRRRAY